MCEIIMLLIKKLYPRLQCLERERLRLRLRVRPRELFESERDRERERERERLRVYERFLERDLDRRRERDREREWLKEIPSHTNFNGAREIKMRTSGLSLLSFSVKY